MTTVCLTWMGGGMIWPLSMTTSVLPWWEPGRWYDLTPVYDDCLSVLPWWEVVWSDPRLWRLSVLPWWEPGRWYDLTPVYEDCLSYLDGRWYDLTPVYDDGLSYLDGRWYDLTPGPGSHGGRTVGFPSWGLHHSHPLVQHLIRTENQDSEHSSLQRYRFQNIGFFKALGCRYSVNWHKNLRSVADSFPVGSEPLSRTKQII